MVKIVIKELSIFLDLLKKEIVNSERMFRSYNYRYRLIITNYFWIKNQSYIMAVEFKKSKTIQQDIIGQINYEGKSIINKKNQKILMNCAN